MRIIIATVALAILANVGFTQDMPLPGICGVSVVQPNPTNRIVNGEAVIPHSRPYQLLLVGYFPNGTAKYYCGASLVKTTHVLTAAHCVAGNAAENIRLYAGIHNFTSAQLRPENGVAARQFFVHESYSNTSLSNDVAVVRLQVPFEVDNYKVGLICLADSAAPTCNPGNPVVASGWGSMTGNPNRTSASRPVQLQQVELECADGSNADCRQLTYTLSIFQDKSKMCAYAPNKGVCFGDSGGPLVRKRVHTDGTPYLEQVGIMSGTVDCSFTKPRPDIYANVRQLSPWILGKIKASL